MRGHYVRTEFDEIDKAIMRGIAEGKTNEQIADGVSLSPETVKKRIAVIGEMLGSGHRAAIVARALRQRVIE